MNSTKDDLLNSFGLNADGTTNTDPRVAAGSAGATDVAITLDDMQSAVTILVDTALKLQDYTTIDPETYELLRKRLVSRAEDFVNASLLKSLTDDQRAEFGALLKSGSPTDQELYLREHIPEIHKVIHAGLKAFCDAYLSDEEEVAKTA